MRRMIGLVAVIAVLVMFSSLKTTTAFSQCGTVANDLSLTLPCVEYEGQYYKINFSVYTNTADPTWLYWRFESIQPASGSASCAHINTTLTITAPCVYYAGYNLAITLEYCPGITGGLYWKLGSQLTLNPVTINSISGDTTELLLPYYSSPEFQASMNAYFICIQQCNPTDPTCIMACMPDLGLGSAFSLAFELCNPGITPIEFCIPAGAYFEPGSGDVQPMLIGVDECLVVPPEECKIFLVPTYCMDGGASAPSSEDVYGIARAGIAQQPCIAKILDLIRGKDISHTDSYTVQEAVWNCIDFGSITETQRTALEKL